MATHHTSPKSALSGPGFMFILFLILFAGSTTTFGFKIVRVASGLDDPLYVTYPPGDADRIFIVEQHTGRIKILDLATKTINPEPFLDIDGLSGGNEQGLLGLAFDPNYIENGFFYVDLTIANGSTEIRRYQVSANNPDLADPASESLVMTYSQPFSNHNGGWVGFGPDGYLYICAGDGGNANDPGNRAQDITDQRLGKIMRIDVRGDDFPSDPQRNYSIPPTNPFVGKTGDDEIWAYGLRNPWRVSFDRLTGDLYIADVGQSAREEVNFQPAWSTGGENYGWRVMEGTRCNFSNDALPCNDPSFVMPIHEYSHVGAPDGGNSITGGYVYRGPVTELDGLYFFADYVSRQIWSFRYDGENKTEFTNRSAEFTPDAGSINNVSSFGEDAAGNLYIVDLDGEVFQLTCEHTFSADFDFDCDVDRDDFALLASVWLSHPGDIRWDPRFDISTPKDDKIDSLDVEVLLDQWQEDPRLVAHWKLDESAGGTAHDSIGDNDAILIGNPLWQPFEGPIGGALELDGVDDYAIAPLVIDPATTSFSIFLWIKGGTPGQGIISHANDANMGVNWLSTNSQDGALLTALTGDSRGSQSLVSNYVVTDGQWHQIGLVWNRTTGIRTLYTDMIIVAQDQNIQGDLRSAQGSMFLGADTSLSQVGLWAGSIDDVRIYNQPVTPDQL